MKFADSFIRKARWPIKKIYEKYQQSLNDETNSTKLSEHLFNLYFNELIKLYNETDIKKIMPVKKSEAEDIQIIYTALGEIKKIKEAFDKINKKTESDFRIFLQNLFIHFETIMAIDEKESTKREMWFWTFSQIFKIVFSKKKKAKFSNVGKELK